MTGALAAAFAAFKPSAGGPSVNSLFGIATYTGDGTASRSITPNAGAIDMTSGGMVWVRGRNAGQNGSFIFSADGSTMLTAGTTSASARASTTDAFTATGLTLNSATHNVAGRTYVAYFFKRASRFFDVISYTGNGANRTVAHNLGVAPGFMLFQGNALNSWHCYHSALGNGTRKQVIGPLASTADATWLNNTAPDASNITLGTGSTANQNTVGYYAFLFAHDSASDGVIQACTYTGNSNASGPSVTSMGWQPNLVFTMPNDTNPAIWFDQVRSPGFSGSDASVTLNDNSTESTALNIGLVSGGFQLLTSSGSVNASGTTYLGLVVRAP